MIECHSDTVDILKYIFQTIKDDDILIGKDSETDESDLCTGSLMLPRTAEGLVMRVPNCCVVCLDDYKAGDIVVWSPNNRCGHAFHRTCVVKYFVKMQTKLNGTPCPCCRSHFTDLEVARRKKKPQRRMIRCTPLPIWASDR
jgi:Ring finger domain